MVLSFGRALLSETRVSVPKINQARNRTFRYDDERYEICRPESLDEAEAMPSGKAKRTNLLFRLVRVRCIC